MTKQTIKVEGLPEGWIAKEVHIDPDQYNKYVGDDGFLYWEAKIKMEKIQPRWIVLEETDEETNEGIQHFSCSNSIAMTFTNTRYKWSEVKETDLSLNSDEPKLSLSKKDMLDLIAHIKLGGQLNPKIAKFIDYEQPESKLSLSVEQCKKFIDGSIRDRSNFFQLVCEFIKDKG